VTSFWYTVPTIMCSTLSTGQMSSETGIAAYGLVIYCLSASQLFVGSIRQMSQVAAMTFVHAFVVYDIVH